MTNKNETIIEQLHGRLAAYKGTADLLEGCTIYDETGHVDCDFFTAILEFLAESTSVEISVQRALHKMLGIEETDVDTGKKGKADAGTKWTAEEILKHCTLEDNVLKLPPVQFNKKSYLEAKKWIEEAGGQWRGGKVQGFMFPFNAERVFAMLKDGRRCRLQQDFQFFATPDFVADRLVSLAAPIEKGMRILEPSAGQGAIVNAILRACPDAEVDCYELMPENRELLGKVSGAVILGEDFLGSGASGYDIIVANPPFAGNRDIAHVRAMYDALAPGGRLVTVMGTHWEMGQESVCREFRDWITEIGASVEHLPAGTFKDSGTVTATTIIKIER